MPAPTKPERRRPKPRKFLNRNSKPIAPRTPSSTPGWRIWRKSCEVLRHDYSIFLPSARHTGWTYPRLWTSSAQP